MGIRLFAYSTGMAVAQQLLFSNSTQGNLLNYIENYFDVLVGQKNAPQSFRKIAYYSNTTTPQMLFITDTVAEGKAAKEAGCQAVLVQRSENRPLSPVAAGDMPVVTSLTQIEFT